MKLFASVILAAAFTGCLQDNQTPDLGDGTSRDVAQEIVDMGQAAEFSQFSGLAKSAADTVRIEGRVIREPWTLVEGWWVRTADVTLNNFTAEKIDRIQFTDTAGNPQQRPDWSSTAGWIHERSVERTGLRGTHHLEFTMTVTVEDRDQKTARWNGSITGTWNSEAFSSCTVTDVVRKRGDGFWLFPESGHISIERPLRNIEIEYTGDGGAEASIVRKRDGEATHLRIDVETGRQEIK